MKNQFNLRPLTFRLITIVVTLLLLALVSTVFAQAAKTSEKLLNSTTATNLQASYAAEMNTYNAYLEYATKADDEGYTAIASLFRALAQAKEFNTVMHAKQMKQMGITPELNAMQPLVKTTKENLMLALNFETRDSKEIYPAFADQAKIDNVQKASYIFTDFSQAAAMHASLIQKALDSPKSWTGKKMVYYVCPVCGNIMTKRPVDCPICDTPGIRFAKVT